MINTHKIVGSQVIRLSKIASTNSFTLDLLSKDKPPEGTVVMTAEQTQGRGQTGSSWESEPHKNVALSVVFYPKFLHPREQFNLSKVVSLAIWDALHDFLGDSVQIKWPNDIYVGKKKIGGILIQNTISTNQILSSVVGIGINVNQINFSSDLPNPISFKLEKGKDFELEKVTNLIFEKLDHYYLQLRTRNFELIEKAYLNRLYQFGIEANYKDLEGNTFSGKISGITKTGKLKVEVSNEMRIFDLKEIRFL